MVTSVFKKIVNGDNDIGNTDFDFYINRSSHRKEKGVLKICSKFKGEQPCQKVISINLLCTLAWMSSAKFTSNFQNTFNQEHLWAAASVVRYISALRDCFSFFKHLSLNTFYEVTENIMVFCFSFFSSCYFR